ncbi:AER016Cp [Eremothecium gossypii ATCC 10895]|uniref:Anaphase-promoting complex subunit 11 n=1 Tax=Eremothecium gossypii (strain ATCC 10895 / CBS 109.51 / FGSC 9923 / NRRL Y-1056) TaxID=284811 RepID=Q757J7_EREGS|nr:AER016Cp [Eremothecium gossypii ATCC 10895]AAS52700.1 AER016Cp [Eremothecium gossypii ATCC 10895]AEY97005.1 FAER016Cp [Eremothecium gossypii FDAG1]AGO12370.1 AaceriAER016Cp [[Ashbya] aceris (nom. inval.)]
MQLQINNIQCVASWYWDVPKELKRDSPVYEDEDEEDVCGICRGSYNGTCPNCKLPGETCPLIVGSCHHNFHVHCIYQWLNTSTSKGLCPMCRQAFSLREGIRINEPHRDKFEKVLMKARQQSVVSVAGANPVGPDQDDVIIDQEFIR